jgi:hypothetical protein
MKWSEVDISLNYDVVASFHSSSEPESPNLGQLGQCNGIRLYPYALETAYQWLKHLIYV